MDINGRFPVQSLYYSCLNYLQNNYKLINFTVLNNEIALDMSIAMKNPEHLKKYRMISCRLIYRNNKFASYFYKYHKDIIIQIDITAYMNSFIENNRFIQYIPGVMAINPINWIIYEPSNGHIYSARFDEYEYSYEIAVRKLRKIYPDILVDNDTRCVVYSEEFFDQFPGFSDWAESVGDISKKLWIPENLLTVIW